VKVLDFGLAKAIEPLSSSAAAAIANSAIMKGAYLWDDTQIVARSLDTGTQTVLVTGGSDGRYVSTGHLIYVHLGTLMAVPFDPVRLATNGGNQPAWSPNGRELFYVQGFGFDGGPIALMSVSVEATPAFRAGTPEKLFESVDLRSAWGRSYDVAPDGRRFVMTLDKAQAKNPAPAQMIFVQHWFEELKRLVPTK